MARKGSVLVVDDEEIMRDVLETLLSSESYRVDLAKTGEEGLDAYTRRSYDVVLLDVSMPGIGGLRALEEFLKLDAEAVVVMITAYATFDTAIAAWEKGAFGCIRKPFQNEHISATVAAGIRRRRKEEERRSLRQAMSREVDRGAIIGRSDIMQEVFRLVEQVAPARSTILITGESGTGKELIAKAIHESSPRANRPFVTVNSSNIPSELLESELFGHTRGAFTGAIAAKKGYFEVADGGSIFLDEIGDIPPETQVRLLRVIQERSFRRLGATDDLAVDFRLITATNRDLQKDVRRGAFREDLYFRLHVVAFAIPPLRKRVEDILPLCRRTIARFAQEFGKPTPELDPDARAMLERYQYPGNIRELQNILERAMIFCQGHTLTANYLPRELHQDVTQPITEVSQGDVPVIRIEMRVGKHTLRETEEAIIEETLRLADYNKSLAAKQLGLTRFSLDRRLKKLADN